MKMLLCLCIICGLQSLISAEDPDILQLASADGKEIKAKLISATPTTVDFTIPAVGDHVFNLPILKFSAGSQGIIADWRKTYNARTHLSFRGLTLGMSKAKILPLLHKDNLGTITAEEADKTGEAYIVIRLTDNTIAEDQKEKQKITYEIDQVVLTLRDNIVYMITLIQMDTKAQPEGWKAAITGLLKEKYGHSLPFKKDPRYPTADLTWDYSTSETVTLYFSPIGPSAIFYTQKSHAYPFQEEFMASIRRKSQAPTGLKSKF